MSIDCSFKSLTLPGSNEILQSQNSLTFKLFKTVADFSQALSNLHDKFGHELQVLVETFRKRNGELRKERLQCPSSLFQVWELFLQQVEVNSQQHGDISRNFCQTIGNGLVERIFHRKIQSKKIFAHRDRIETILLKSNELLLKCYSDYCQAYALALTNPAQYMSEYIASHNVYVHQLQATNGMIHAYQTKTLPKLLEELDECHLETSSSISSSLLESSEFVYQKCQEQASGYQLIGQACKQANHRQDLAQFVRAASLVLQSTKSDNSEHQQQPSEMKISDDNLMAGSALATNQSAMTIRYHQFQSPNLQTVSLPAGLPLDPKNMQIVPTFKNEIAPDLSQPPSQQQPQLEQDRENLEEKIEKFEERIETVHKLLARSQESRLHNKANELQEELSQRRFDLQVAQIHLSAVRSQLQLFEYNYRPNQAALSLLQQQQQPQGSCQQAALSNAAAAAAAQTDLDASGGGGGGSLALLAANHQMGSNYQLNSLTGGGSGLAGLGLSLAGSQSSGLGSRKSSSNLHHNQTSGYRNKWIKALKSLKEPTSSSGSTTPVAGNSANVSAAALAVSGANQKFVADSSEQDSLQQAAASNQQQQQQQQLENQHFFQEYTFKKIASCDVCKDFLRGHMRQGVKCKLCKISSHNDCQSKAHATIKCQQPKIKLLRRQKSAGELEVNNLDLDGASEQTNERSSKPDSIYSLIRQVLDAKKRGGHPQQPVQQQQQHVHPSLLLQAAANDTRLGQQLGNSAFMLSSGNLSLANQNGGKSVSTSALQAGPTTTTNVSVDRWSVVMDLLAQSRKKDKDNYQLDGQPGETLGGGAGKRHSKQLDKFKSAAKSAAAASRHHQYLQQSPLQQTNAIFGQQQQYNSMQQQLGPSSSSSPPSHQYPTNNHPAIMDDYLAQPQSQPMHSLQAQQPQAATSGEAGLHPQSQQLHLHHTKSLPVGSKQQQQQQQQLVGSMPPAQQHMQMQQQQQHHQHHHHQLAHEVSSSVASPSSSNFGQHQQQQQSYQLLNIGSQQLQSTSAPHSPQRKRFNLRMKSFSLDSPESPSVQQQPNTSSVVNSIGGSASSVDPSYIQQQPPPFEHQLAMQQEQQHLYQQPASHMYLNQTSSAGYQQPQSNYLTTAAYHQQQQQHQRQFDEEAGSAYWRQARQQYNHRHSYHNPPFHYQQQQHDNSNSSKQSNTSASNSNANNDPVTTNQRAAGQQQQQQQLKQRRDSSAGLELGIGAAKQQRASSSSGPSGSVGQPTSGQQVVANNKDDEYYDLNLDVSRRSQADVQAATAVSSQQQSKSQQQQQQQQQPQSQSKQQKQQQQQQQQPSPGGTFVALYDYNAQRADEIQLSAGQLVALVDSDERDWWKIRPLDGSNRLGYFPASYLTELYQNERPLRVIQTIQVSDGEICDKLLRGQIVMHTGKQMDSFVTIRLVATDLSNHYIQCPDKYLMEINEPV